MDWIDISVFISSTFNDMHAERDLLLKKVFPILSEWCARRRIRLFDIDLRWGVTSEASKNKNTVEVCLRNVDKCRPFFLCFLGQRRGYIPSEINPETYKNYPGIRNHMGKSSVTEMEIEHALLTPMLRLIDGKNKLPKAAKNSLFFVRDSSYLSSLNKTQRMIFTNADAEDEKATDAAHEALIARVRKEWPLVWDYSCRFDTSLYSTELTSRGEEVAKGRLTDFKVQGEPLECFIIEAMKKQILSTYPNRMQEVSVDAPEQESYLQQQRLEDLWHGSLARKRYESKLTAYCKSPNHHIFYLYGKPGSGKTTLLAQFFHDNKDTFGRHIIRFGGITPYSTRWVNLWKGILEELNLPAEAEDLPNILNQIADTGRTLIAIDGVDELEEGLSALASLPASLPDNLSLILSFRSDAPGADMLLAHLQSTNYAELCELSPLSGKQEVEALIDTYLKQYLKAFDDDQIQAICESPSSYNPLFLKILLQELRVFGSRRQIVDQIAEYGNTPKNAFSKMLDNLEHEISYNPIPAAIFVPQLTGILSLARGSISRHILKQALQHLLAMKDEDISDTMSFYLRRLGPYLFSDGDRLGMSYSSLREAASERYGSLALAQHNALAAACFEDDPLECLYHYRMANNRRQVSLLTKDIPFLCNVIHHSGAVLLLQEMKTCASDNSFYVSIEVLDCLQQTAALIGREAKTAAALFYKELSDPVLREASSACCPQSWLRYEPIAMDIPESANSAVFQTLFSVEHLDCEGFSIARDKEFAFLLTGEKDITICNLLDGTKRPPFSLPVQSRIRKIVCSPDGTLLAAATEDLVLSLFRVALDDSLRLLALNSVFTDQYATVRFGGICLFAAQNGLIWQRPDGAFVRCPEGSSSIMVSLPETNRLVGCFSGGTIQKSAGTYLIIMDSGLSLSFPARVNTVLSHDGCLFVATEDKHLTSVNAETGEILQEFLLPSESLGTLVILNGILYGADRYGTLVRLQENKVETLGRIMQNDNIVDTFTQLHALTDGKLAFVSCQRYAKIIMESESLAARLLRFFPQSNGVSFLWDLGKELTAVLVVHKSNG